jgi:flagellar secretion chaperone FliS
MFAQHNRYQETEVNTASPVKLVLVLYDAAIERALRAKKCLEEGDLAGKGDLISKAIDIISELQVSLDMANGGNMAENLRRLYSYCIDRLIEANIKKDTKQLDAAVRVLCTLREGWEGIMHANADGLAVQPTQDIAQYAGTR